MIADVNNNFYLDVTNTGLTETQVSLFGLGQVGFDFATYNVSSVTYDFSTFVNSAGLTIYPVTYLFLTHNDPSPFNPINCQISGVGTPFSLMAVAIKVSIDITFPNSDAKVYVTQVNGSVFNITIYTLPTLLFISGTVGDYVLPFEPFSFSNSTVVCNTLNPNITVSSQTSYLDLRQSLNGTVYSLVCFDLNSDNQMQLTQPITFRRKNAFGDREISSVTPVIDPYAGNAATIGKIDSYNFLLDVECSLYFNIYGGQVSNNQIVPNTIRLYFYYAKWTVENFKNFEMAYRFGFLQEVYNLEQLMTEQRLKSILLS